MSAYYLQITGTVQGVGFRAFVKQQADRLQLDGFVRNRKDGSVEALVVGEQSIVEELITLCHQGPIASKVANVQITEAKGVVDKGFKHLPTV